MSSCGSPDQSMPDIQGQFECRGPVQRTVDIQASVAKANLSYASAKARTQPCYSTMQACPSITQNPDVTIWQEASFL